MLGQHIRKLRMQRGLSGSELARRAGVSRSLISQIERGTSSPSVDVLRRIANTLDIRVGMLFDEPEDAVSPNGVAPLPAARQARARVVRRGERKVLSLPASQIRYELLSPDLQGRLEFVQIEVRPGQAVPAVGWSHEGEESQLILQGTAHFYYGEELFVLEEGDAITFDSSIPHRLVNPGTIPVIAISAGTPPSF